MNNTFIRARAECTACLKRKYPYMVPEDAPAELVADYQKRVFEIIEGAPDEYASPVIVRDISDVHEEIFGTRIQYTEQKSYYNRLMLDQEDRLREAITEAADPLERAIQYAIVGNYIDLSAFASLDEGFIWESLQQTDRFPLPEKGYKDFCTSLNKAKNVVFLTDNCGEIVVDKLLIETILGLYPDIESFTAIVKGAEVQNDATMEDAAQTGLDRVVRVIGNGNNIAGTWLPECSEEAVRLIESADLIISKGQANLETLRGLGLPIYYIFMCKCTMLSEDYGVPVLTGMLLHE